jgi:hypothetical protein
MYCYSMCCDGGVVVLVRWLGGVAEARMGVAQCPAALIPVSFCVDVLTC